jgi:hypothetical protein
MKHRAVIYGGPGVVAKSMSNKMLTVSIPVKSLLVTNLPIGRALGTYLKTRGLQFHVRSARDFSVLDTTSTRHLTGRKQAVDAVVREDWNGALVSLSDKIR